MNKELIIYRQIMKQTSKVPFWIQQKTIGKNVFFFFFLVTFWIVMEDDLHKLYLRL